MSSREFEPLRPDGAAELLVGLDAWWWIAGGWAIDLFVGAERPHKDVDISMLRRDAPALAAALPEWELCVASPEGLEPWQGGVVAAGANLWGRPDGADRWWLEFVFENETGGMWTYRRDDAIRRPMEELGSVRKGLPVLAPEIVLLFKARSAGPQDQSDFERALPLLEPAARTWLAAALERAHPGHRWLGAL